MAIFEAPKHEAVSTERVVLVPSLQHSFKFKACFAGDMIESKLIADQNTGANFILESLLEAIIKYELSIELKDLRPSHVYRNVTGCSCLTGIQLVNLNVCIYLRHGTRLLLHSLI